MIASNLSTLQGSTEGFTGVNTDGVVVEVVVVFFVVFLVGLGVETGEDVMVLGGFGGAGPGPLLDPE